MNRTLSLLICLSLFGCATIGRQVNVNEAGKIKIGTTTKQEVIKLFGQPSSISAMNTTQTTFTYIGSRASNTAWNFIPGVNLVHSQMDVSTTVLTVIFDENGVVKDYNFSSSNTPIKSGIIP